MRLISKGGKGGAADQQLTLHSGEARRGMAKHSGQLQRLNEKPSARAVDGRSARGKRDNMQGRRTP